MDEQNWLSTHHVPPESKKPLSPEFQNLGSKYEDELNYLLTLLCFSNELEYTLRRCLIFRYPDQNIDRLLIFERTKIGDGRLIKLYIEFTIE
jgi:hypothetical protein